ncbi:murein L,D-transpeptidase catalytic domain-containing protein [Chryseobacterium sp.]|uniref:murein L,D-transpeptidase catalytic domain-containing protein n=1 Tax=Chryseobacterium sp. TaxID=1871047 RepID=UPI00389048DA
MKGFLLIFVLFLNFLSCHSPKDSKELPAQKIVELKEFIKNKEYNQDIAVFINFKTHSGKYRYFVYDLKNDKILQKSIVSHGSGSVMDSSNNLQFSNTEGSYQSSLGKYVIREKYIGKFGKSYRLDGLDELNNNARERAIVIHALDCVPDVESSQLTCLSLGCPMLSPKALEATSKYIDRSAKPIILYAFY